MDLQDLRNKIDKVDNELLSGFEKRMDLCRQVASYKKENNISVFQGNRESEIIEKVRSQSSEKLKDGSEALFLSIMDISKTLQQHEVYKNVPFRQSYVLDLSKGGKVICQGTEGANSEEATMKLFGNKCSIDFCEEFNDVFKAVENNSADFGILPILNSTTGSITQTYDLMKKYDCYICASAEVEIHHCLAVRKGVRIEDVTSVYSHPQALAQCSKFLKKNNFTSVSYINTAVSARYVKESSESIASICSERCAELYDLEIIERNISDAQVNNTKFICISKSFFKEPDADTVSILITLPHRTGSLYRLLTKFFVSGLNLKKIESRPIADGSFDVMFYLDFEGNVDNLKVASLMTEIESEVNNFKFLGNFKEHK